MIPLLLYCLGVGLQWSNMAQGASVDDDFTMLNVIVMLLIDSALYLVVMWYVEAVFPGEYGIPQPWYFPVLVRIGDITQM